MNQMKLTIGSFALVVSTSNAFLLNHQQLKSFGGINTFNDVRKPLVSHKASLDGEIEKASSSRRRFIEVVSAFSIVQTFQCDDANASEAAAVLDYETNDANNLNSNKTLYIPKKPFAPLSALLPAARVKSTIDNALKVTNDIIEIDTQIQKSNSVSNELTSIKKEKVMILQEIIQREQRGFMQPFNVEPSNTNNIIFGSNPSTVRMPSSNTKLYDDTYKEQIKNTPVTEIPLALFSQAGDKRQFGILQKRQRRLEKKSPIREALNFYTRQIQFNTESYVLNVNSEEKKKMIRNDALPDIKSVIVSDLDLRDLIRNQILDAFDDVRAEFQYQIRNDDNSGVQVYDSFDASELQVLLIRAQRECNRWFDFIDDNDVEEAMNAVSKESN